MILTEIILDMGKGILKYTKEKVREKARENLRADTRSDARESTSENTMENSRVNPRRNTRKTTRKYIVYVLTVLMTVFAATTIIPNSKALAADAALTPVIRVDNTTITAGTSAAYYENDVLMYPAAELAGLLGQAFSFDRRTLSARFLSAENELVFRLDNNIAKHNGKLLNAGGRFGISNIRYMVPLDFVATISGYEIFRDEGRNIIHLMKPVDGSIVYKVMPGDSLWYISRVFRTSIDEIIRLNSLKTTALYIGQVLRVRLATASLYKYEAVTNGGTTIFSSPSFNSSVIGYLTRGTAVAVTAKTCEQGSPVSPEAVYNWYRAVTPKGTGYIYQTVLNIRQDIADTVSDSRFFNNKIPIDTSADFVTYTDYKVVKGDTVWSVSSKYGIPDYELLSANNLPAGAYLSIGQILKIPVHNIPVKYTLGNLGELLDWFSEANYVFPIGTTGKITDLESGKSFNIKRSMGANHADIETLTAADTSVMKSVFGGSFNWNKRSFILETNGRRLAVSVAGMPHAGVDGAPFLANVSNRSGDFGYGPNYDSIAGNGMNGHFDLYFLNCLRHVDNTIDAEHQYNVMRSAGLK